MEQERGLLRYQPSLREWLDGLGSSESFFTDLGKIMWSMPMMMLTGLVTGDRSLLIRERTLCPLESFLGRRLENSYQGERLAWI